MKLCAFRIQMYKSILDSGWISVSDLTVLVGKNEAGKTSLLKALHKFKPFQSEPYNVAREWPRGHRGEKTGNQIVCSTEFDFGAEREEFESITDEPILSTRVRVHRQYGGALAVEFLAPGFPDRHLFDDIETLTESLPWPQGFGGSSEVFKLSITQLLEAVSLAAREGRIKELADVSKSGTEGLRRLKSADPAVGNAEEHYINNLGAKLSDLSNRLAAQPTIRARASSLVLDKLPTFVFMDEYRTFHGSARLDQVKQRKDGNALTEEDRTLMTILALAGLDFEEENRKSAMGDREERQFDLSDASATLNAKIEDHWRQLRYQVDFRADGPQFFTYVRGRKDPALIRLEERSRGFQWFFSFDLMLMHETSGTFKNCVILLDEPGLHLHPEAQQDLLERLEEYARENTLIYTTHLPFMINLREPERIRVISETDHGTVVGEDLTTTQAEAKLVLQAALGISGRQSFLLADHNLVVEGVDDYWILTALSNLFARAGKSGISDGVMVTPAGGASEVTYIATLMVGQDLGVVALYDTDASGNTAKEKFEKAWLARYKDRHASALSLGPAVGVVDRDFAIEDLFEEAFYKRFVVEAYERELRGAAGPLILAPGGQLCRRVADGLAALEIKYNKGSVAKRLCQEIRSMKKVDELGGQTVAYVERLFASINKAASK